MAAGESSERLERLDPPDQRRDHLMMGDLGLYVHVPFCRRLCTYCDFYKLPLGRRESLAGFLQALHREIDGCAAQLPERERGFDTVFLGGGTPSLMEPEEIGTLLAHLRREFRPAADPEITLEVNPETPLQWLAEYRRAGVNRLSFGMQSLDDRQLQRLGREHSAARAIEALRAGRAAGFDNINLDLLAGVPGQSLSAWEDQLREIVGLEPNHLSVYLLETDKPTPLSRDLQAGRVRLPDENTQVEIYRRSIRMLDSAGLRQYEISNFCTPGKPCRHNLKYWQDRPFLGFGPAAHGYLHHQRYAHPRDLEAYLADPVPRLPRPIELDPAARRQRAEEAAIFGLRLAEGIRLEEIEARYRVSLPPEGGEVLAPFVDAGLVGRTPDGRMRLQERGMILSNEVFAALLGTSSGDS